MLYFGSKDRKIILILKKHETYNLLTQSVHPAIFGHCVLCVDGKRATYCRLVRGHDEEVATDCFECVENETSNKI